MQKLLPLPNAVISALRSLIESSGFRPVAGCFFIPKALQNGAHTLFVTIIRRRGPAVVFDTELSPQIHKFRGDGIHEFLRRDALLFRGLLDLLPVLINAREEENMIAREPVIAGNDVGEHLLVGMADVRRAIRVIDGGGDEKGCWECENVQTQGSKRINYQRRLIFPPQLKILAFVPAASASGICPLRT